MTTNPDGFSRPRKTYPCDNPSCSNRVVATKPSKSGLHFCTRSPACQAAKQKALRVHRGESVKSELANGALALVEALLTKDRVKCWGCGLTNALPGYAHPDGKGGGCVSLGQTPYGGPEFGPRAVQLLWPIDESTWEPEA